MTPAVASRGQGGPLRALKHYNFRVFWLGQLLSLVGSWMQGIAQSWLILVMADPSASVHHSGSVSSVVNHVSTSVQATANRYQGEVNFWQGFPVLVLTIFAGVLIDRVNKRRLLLVTQIGFMSCAALLGFLIRTGHVQISYVMIIACCVGLFLSFDMPARQSFVVELVGRKDIPSAVALNSSMFNSARAVGPAVAGLLLIHYSLATCFFLNAASYVLVIASLLMMRGKTLGDPGVEAREHILDDLKAGFTYVWGNHTTRNVVLLVGGLGMFAFSYNVLVPTFVRYTLLPHSDSAEQVKTFGYLESVRGIGALAAALCVGLFSRPDRYKWYLVGGGLLSNALLMIFAWERNMTVAYVTMAVVTFGFVLIFASANTVMQLTIPDNLRGRVMSIYMLVFIGTGPIGSLLAGWMAQYVGAPWTIFSFALLTFLIVAAVSFRPGGLTTINVGLGEMLPHATPQPAATETEAN